MRFFWRVSFLFFLALTCVLLGMSIRVSFDWLNLQGADKALDRTEIEQLREQLNDVKDPFESVISVAQVVQPSVVSIEVEAQPVARGFFMSEGGQRGGSGVILDSAGHILTNYHVIGEPKPKGILIRMEDARKKPARARLIGYDQYADLAVLKLEKADSTLVPAELGDSSSVRVGQAAIAIGSPFSLQGTVTLGMVSTTARAVETGTQSDVLGVESYIQTDAAINPGNSGGPLVDIHGRVIGINTMIVTRTSAGVGFAIPINYAKQIVAQLIEGGTVRRGGLGIKLATAESPRFGLPPGALVEVVGRGTPAARAGFEYGDLVVEYNGREIRQNRDLIQAVQQTSFGTEVRVVVLRKDRYLTLYATVGDRSDAIKNLPQEALPDDNRRQ